jgi:hypothetical protein
VRKQVVAGVKLRQVLWGQEPRRCLQNILMARGGKLDQACLSALLLARGDAPAFVGGGRPVTTRTLSDWRCWASKKKNKRENTCLLGHLVKSSGYWELVNVDVLQIALDFSPNNAEREREIGRGKGARNWQRKLQLWFLLFLFVTPLWSEWISGLFGQIDPLLNRSDC